MKLIKEHIIIEKFTEDSDPIKDMNIGTIKALNKWIESSNILDDWNIENDNELLRAAAYYGKTEFIEYLINTGADVHTDDERPLKNAACNNHIDTAITLIKHGADLNKAIEYARFNNHKYTLRNLEKIKNIVENQVNEKFTEDSDPIHDMNIGHICVIKDFLNTHYKGINQYKINKDLTVDITFGDFEVPESYEPLPFKLGTLVADYYIPEKYFITPTKYKMPESLKPKKILGKVYPQLDDWLIDLAEKIGSPLDIYLNQIQKKKLWKKLREGYKIKNKFFDADESRISYTAWNNKTIEPLIKNGWIRFNVENNFGQVEVLLLKK
jgi:hypothetical protein